MDNIKYLIDKVKQKNTEFKAKQEERKAASKGFSSASSYNFYADAAKTEGETSGKSELRKKELKRIKDEAREEVMMGRSGKYGKFQKKVQGGMKSFQSGMEIYNDVMGGLHSLGSGGDSYQKQNSNQAYASGYGLFDSNKPKRRRPTAKKTKSNRKSKPRQPRSFMDQFMNY